MSRLLPDDISRYLDEDMTVEERFAFEAAVRSDPGLRRELDQTVRAMTLLRSAFQDEQPPLRATLKAMAIAPQRRSGPCPPHLLAFGLFRRLHEVRGHQMVRRFKVRNRRHMRLNGPT